jgi:Membrane protein involved in colicin uptake
MNIGVKKWLYLTGAAIFFIVVLGSCGGRKNTATSRFYHSLNSRYNIYFNGKTTFDDALKSLNNGYQENYTEQIFMFPVSGQFREEKSTTGGPFNRAIEKGNKAIRLHSIKDKPPRKAGWQNDPKQVKLQEQEEFNPFMKHCWLLIGESHFYNGDFLTAAVTFSYITRHFTTDKELVAEALIWQARCYTELKWFYEANNVLKKLSESGIPPKLQKNYDRMYADYLIRNEQIENAIPYLQSSIKSEKNKRQRSRQRYLLGQLYMSSNQNELAYKTFGKVASSNPPYEIEFSSRIRQTEVFPGGNYEKVLKMLRKMSKSDKNKDYLDQVFYAMGNVYMTQSDTVKAISSYAEGIEKSTQNGMNKAICQIRLGDIYFTQKDYLNAQPCFSGALAGIHKEYKDYERVARLSETLDELVVHYEAVHLQDSLQELARMPEKDRLAAIDKIIAQVIEEEKKAQEEAEKEEYLAQQASLGSNLNLRNTSTPAMPMGGRNESSFYFYNTQVVAQGKTQFQNKWGKRPLEDNWRRRNKKMALLIAEDEGTQTDSQDSSEEMTEEMIAKSDSLQAISEALASDPKKREYYLQQIPLTEEDLEASNIIIENGLYNMGMVYKDRLEDMTLSVGTFEDLEKRFPENSYRLDYYYQIYLMALRYKDDVLAEKYKNKMIAEFPESDYTTAISDPDYEYNIRMMDSVQDSIYELTYESYLAEDTANVSRNYAEFSSKYPLANLLPKFMFLKALTYVQAGDAEGFKEALTTLTEKFPSADVSELANEMLKNLLRGRKLMQSSFSTMTWDLRFGLNAEGELSSADSARTFITEQAMPHRMLLIYTTGSIDRNQLLYAVAAYNFANFRVKGFDISFEEVGTLTILTIKGFDNFSEIIDYYRLIYGQGGYASALDGIVSFFPFSDENYDVLMHGKTLEEYMRFFVENYGEVAPDLVDRWRVRVDTDRQAAEEEQAKQELERKEREESAVSEITVTDDNEDTEVKPVIVKEDTVRTQIEPEIITIPVIQDTIPVLDKTIVVPETEEEDRPAAKKGNIFRKLFKRIKETDEFISIQEGINTAKELAGEEEMPADSVETKPLERVDGELTFDQLQEMRRLEAEETAVQQAEETLSKEEAKKAADELKKQQAKERDELRKQKEKETKERLAQKEKERKQKKNENKLKQKQRVKESREKEKAKRAAQKEKSAQSKAKKK